ncbi:hypothetical protein JCGZ_02275 [Jatropha curcas]|uniref:PRA1 family protein n=1 Tax=Jatropha curcas TaxID=180498 RepID=A0A067KVX9_JATCU|nr:PRA1 family protein D [Jatropha curcas]KDP40277.1 hypothetical protein JCGZ_02275 [Jatropha curcas]
MTTAPQFLSGFKQTAQSLNAGLRPWSVFLDLTSLNLPSSIPDATTRITQNLTHFRSNYSLIILIVLFLSLFYHPLSLIAFLITFIAWVFLYFSRNEPLIIFGYQVNDLVVLVLLFVATILVLIWSGVWLNLLVAVVIGVVLVVLHAVLRSTDDLVADDIETSPYVNLLSDDDSPRGGLEL